MVLTTATETVQTVACLPWWQLGFLVSWCHHFHISFAWALTDREKCPECVINITAVSMVVIMPAMYKVCVSSLHAWLSGSY